MTLKGTSSVVPLLGLFLCIFGAKLLLIHQHGNPTPFWDQWDAEAAYLYLPCEQGHYDWSQLVSAHNEHRLLWVRLLGLLELRLNGGIWDPVFQMVVNAGLHGLTIVLLLALLRKGLPVGAWIPLVLFSLILTLPAGWENTLAGFQSQFYFLVLFSMLGIGLLIAAPALGAKWWLGLLAVIAACFAMASGLLAGLAVAACYLGQMVAERRLELRKCLGLGMLMGCALGAWAFTPEVAQHAPLKAAGIQDLATAFFKSLAFPFQTHPFLAVLVQLPLLALMGRLVFGKRSIASTARPPWFLLGAGLWVWLNAAATAYGRGANGAEPASRYLDTLALGNVINFAAAFYLVPPWRSRWPKGIWLGWTAILLAGWLGSFGNHIFGVIRNEARLCRIQEDNVRRFLADFDRERWAQLPYYSIPYPSAERLAGLLENETVRGLLPTELRRPLQGRVEANAGFLAGGAPADLHNGPEEQVWGSYAAAGQAGAGRIALAYDKPAKGHFLKIPVAGHLRGSGMGLRVETMDGRLLAHPVPGRDPGARWNPLFLRNPGVPFRIVAEDNDPDRWLAFAEPLEAGAGTLLAKLAMRFWPMFVGAGLGLLLLGMLQAASAAHEEVRP